MFLFESQTDSTSGGKNNGRSGFLMNTDVVPRQVMLPGEATTTLTVHTDEWLRPVRIMGCQVGLEVVSSREPTVALLTTEFLAWISAGRLIVA